MKLKRQDKQLFCYLRQNILVVNWIEERVTYLGSEQKRPDIYKVKQELKETSQVLGM